MPQKIPQPVLDLLRSAHIEDNVLLKMPSVDRATYEIFDEVLCRLRGKWYRKKGHRFPYNPTAAIAAVVASGVMPAKNPLAYFPTPMRVAREVVSLLSWWPSRTRVLEPSAGSGALVQAVLEDWPGSDVLAMELDPLNAAQLRARSWERPDWSDPEQEHEPEIMEADFTQIEPREVAGLVVMNPPFAVKGDSMAWETHMRRAWDWLVPEGRIACIAPGNVWNGRGTKRAKAAREWLRSIGAKVYALDRGSFVESGTGVDACVIVAKKLSEADWATPHSGFPSLAACHTWLVVDTCREWAERRDKLVHLSADDPKVEKFLRDAAIHANECEGEIPVTNRIISQLKTDW